MTHKNRQDIKLFRALVTPFNVDKDKLTELFGMPDFSVGRPENLKMTRQGLPDKRKLPEILKPVYTEARLSHQIVKLAKPNKDIVPKTTRKPRKGLVAKTAQELEIDKLNAEAATWSDERLGEELKKVLDQLDGGSKVNEVGQASIAKNDIALRDEPVIEKSVKIAVEPTETQKALIFVIGELTKLLGAA